MVRSGAEATAAELDAAGDKARRLLDRHNISGASATSVQRNRFEIYVKNKERFEATLREKGVWLPDHVVVVESGLCCLRPGPI